MMQGWLPLFSGQLAYQPSAKLKFNIYIRVYIFKTFKASLTNIEGMSGAANWFNIYSYVRPIRNYNYK